MAPPIDLEPAPPGVIPEDDESAVDFLARLRVAVATGRLPEDVGRWAVEVCTEALPALARQQARNRALRMAAGLLTGTTWAKARRLRMEILEARGFRPRRHPPRGRTANVSYYVRQALAVDPETPGSHRHLRRILGDTLALTCPYPGAAPSSPWAPHPSPSSPSAAPRSPPRR